MDPKLWAYAEDCWSPRIQHKETPFNESSVISPTCSKELTIVGRQSKEISAVYNNSLSHSPVVISIKCVRLALEASVTYLPVRKYATQVSMVPNLALPSFTFYLSPGTFSRSQRILNKLKYVETGNPVFFMKLLYFYLYFSHISFVLESHHTIAL